ncbi:efflux RND transporter periplasmic adaptor subunit [Parahaliea maris]|uniref:Efflux RND transporter periplasmic adaptor subunit n=1 Tax=Parahaliea maris TaxID=2716870 RepID=A0A5C9A817_9GAMM|nr:efflux RND transporter periplasmic adaptor subunit [Parahaliea maris]TXS96269.1 efflux RND transporter periplasmic adaptor subunit [Parahaliea maris]
MQNKRAWLSVVAALAVLMLLVAWMAGLFDQRLPPGLEEAGVVSLENSREVVAEAVVLQEPVSGSVEAKQATIISSRTLARIERVHVRAGDSVQRGDLLVELEQEDLAARVKQASQRSDAVAARLREAERSLSRALELQAKGLLAVADLDAAQASRDALQAELQSARQGEREASAALAYAEIRSPIDGRIVDRFAEPGDTATPGQKLLSLYNPLSLRVEAAVREQLALALQPGQQLAVELPALDSQVEATIEEIVPAAQTGSRTFLVKLHLPYDNKLLPGMYARVLIPAGSENKVLLPRDWVAQVGQLSVVLVAGPGGAQRRFVRVGSTLDDGRVEILSGLEPGEWVVAPE